MRRGTQHQHHAFQERHLAWRAPWLRAAVLGANDGLVSTAALMVGVAAADSARTPVLVAGFAGLAAGAMSMAAGEYVSVSTQRDSELADLDKERMELFLEPTEELDEIARIYQGRGLTPELARLVAEQLSEGDQLELHAREELGIDVAQLARPVQAAVVSAASFTRRRAGADRRGARRDARTPASSPPSPPRRSASWPSASAAPASAGPARAGPWPASWSAASSPSPSASASATWWARRCRRERSRREGARGQAPGSSAQISRSDQGNEMGAVGALAAEAAPATGHEPDHPVLVAAVRRRVGDDAVVLDVVGHARPVAEATEAARQQRGLALQVVLGADARGLVDSE